MANVYYSVGQNSTDHKSGTPNVTISSGVATFTVAQVATNLGVGDRLTTAGHIYYLASKISTTQWNVVTAVGGTPGDHASESVTSIAHEYTTLLAAEAGVVDANHINNTSLVTAGVMCYLPCYYDSGADTSTKITWAGMTVDATHYCVIYTPTDVATECNTRQRHTGKWTDTAFSMAISNSTMNLVQQNYIRFTGIQVSIPATSATDQCCFYALSIYGSCTLIFSHNILRGNSANSAVYHCGIELEAFGTTGTQKILIFNNLAYDFGVSNGYGCFQAGDTGQVNYTYLNNNNAYNCWVCFRANTVTANVCISTNNIAGLNTGGYGFNQVAACGVGHHEGSNYNISDGADVTGAQSKARTTASYVNSAGKDWHLVQADTAAKHAGTNLYSNANCPVVDDIDGKARLSSGAFDMGMDTYNNPGTSALTLPITTSTTAGTLKHKITSALTLGIVALACVGTVTPRGMTGTGALTLPIVTSTASGTLKHAATSTNNLPIVSLSSSGIVKHSGTSALTLPIITTTITPKGVKHSGTSSLTLPIVTSTGNGTNKHFATSELTLPIISLTSSGIVKHSGTSELTLPIVTSTGNGTNKHFATSELTLPIITLGSSGVVKHFVTSELSLPIIGLASNGIVKHFGTSELNLPIVSLSSSGIVKHFATSENNLPVITLSANGIFKIAGTASINLPIITLNSSGVVKHYATGEINLPIIELASTGHNHISGSSANILPIITLSGSGIVKHIAASTNNLPVINIESTGINKHFGTGELTLPIIQLTGNSIGRISGYSEINLPIITISSTGINKHFGTSALALPIITLSSTGTVKHFGTSSNNLPIINLESGAITKHIGTGELNLPIVSLSSSGINKHYGTSELSLPIIDLYAEGTSVTPIIYGTSALILPSISLSSSGVVKHFGTSENVLPIITLSASGSVLSSQKYGTGSLNLPIITLESSGIVKHVIEGNIILPEITLSATGIVKHFITSDIVLPEIIITAEGTAPSHAVSGTAEVILPSISLSATGHLKYTGTAELSLPIISLTCNGSPIADIRTDIRLNLQSQLKLLTVSNGYNINIGSVYLEPKSYEDIVNYPSCFPVIDKEEYIQFDVNGMMQKRLSINLNFMFKQINNPQQYASKIIADVEKLLMNNYSLTDKTLDIILNSNIQDLQRMTEDIYFLPINFTLVYKQNIYSPTSQSVGALTSQEDAIPDTVDISLLENIKNAFVYNVQQITTANGNSYNYKTSLIQKDLDSIIEYPYCNFDLNENYVSQSQNGYLYKDVTLTANIYYSGVNNLMLNFDKIVADFEKRFLVHNYLPDSNGRRNCFLMLPKENNLSYIEDNKPLGCVNFIFQILYMNNLTNPKEV